MSITAKLKNPLITNLLLAIVVSAAFIYGTMEWLDSYTRHNQGVIIPDIKGMSLAEGVQFLQERNLEYNVIDSVFSKSFKAGAIVEVTPSVGLKVKSGRIVYITVNARGAQTAPMPAIKDMSFRQAYAILKAKGFESIEVIYVPGTYKDLAIGVELRGRAIEEGERIQINAPLTLVVSNGTVEMSEDIENPEEYSGVNDAI